MKRAVWMPNVPHLDETRKGLYTNQEDQEGVNEGDLRDRGRNRGPDGILVNIITNLTTHPQSLV